MRLGCMCIWPRTYGISADRGIISGQPLTLDQLDSFSSRRQYCDDAVKSHIPRRVTAISHSATPLRDLYSVTVIPGTGSER